MKWILWILFFNILESYTMALYCHTDTQLRRCIIRCRSIISRNDDGIKIESDWQIPFFAQLMTKNWVCHSWKNRSWIDCHKFGSTLELYKCKEERILFRSTKQFSHIIYIYCHYIKLLRIDFLFKGKASKTSKIDVKFMDFLCNI